MARWNRTSPVAQSPLHPAQPPAPPIPAGAASGNGSMSLPSPVMAASDSACGPGAHHPLPASGVPRKEGEEARLAGQDRSILCLRLPAPRPAWWGPVPA